VSSTTWRQRVERARAVPAPEWLMLAALVVLAAVIRYVCRNYYTSDLVVFGKWYDQLKAAGGIHGLREPIGNYNAPFMYLLALALYLPGATLLKIKAIFVVFDVMLVFFVYKIVALRYSGWRVPMVAALIVAFLPTVVINGAMYGQCDAIWGAFAVGSVYFLLRDRQWWAVSFMAAAYAFKPQGVFIFPLLMLLILAGRVRWRTLLALPVVYVALDLPAILLGRNPRELLGLYSRQLDDPSRLARGGPSLFQYLPVTVGTDVLRDLGYLFAGVLVLGICYVLIATRTSLDPARVVTAAACFAILVPFLLPAMHERYFYLADVLSVVLAFYRPRLWYLPLIVQASSFLSYVPFLFLGAHGAFVDRRLLATLMLSALLITGYCLLSDVRGAVLLPAEPEPAPEPAEEPEARTPAPQPRAENDEPAPAPVH
jgi:Gpi18-like mannosyltransferase